MAADQTSRRRRRSKLGHMLQALKREGFNVRAVTETQEGGFRVEVSRVGSPPDLPNEWDEVMASDNG